MKKILGIIMVLLAVGFMAHTFTAQAAVAGPQCSDGIDNDADGLVDNLDPQCHIDGDATNIDSYDPTIEQEVDSTAGCVGCGPRSTGGGGGGGGGAMNICSDGKDNDGDGLIDAADPGCHSDDDLSKTYNPNDLDESNPKPVVPTPTPEPKGEVLGAQVGPITQVPCGAARPCTLQKTGGVALSRNAINRAANLVAKNEQNMLSIPKLKVNQPVLQMDSIKALYREAMILPWTSTPDKGGNTVLVGHAYYLVKGIYSKSTFYELDTMKAGDEIEMTWKGVKYTYVVAETKKVSPTEISIEDQTATPTLTIYSCGRFTNKLRTGSHPR